MPDWKAGDVAYHVYVSNGRVERNVVWIRETPWMNHDGELVCDVSHEPKATPYRAKVKDLRRV